MKRSRCIPNCTGTSAGGRDGVKQIRTFSFKTVGALLKVCVLPLLLSFCRCGTGNASGPGGGTDFPNTKTVAGIILHEDGRAASSAALLLLPSDFVPGSGDPSIAAAATGSTDSTGTFSLPLPDSGTFTIDAVYREAGTRLLITGISAEGGADDTVDLASATLRRPGSITVKIPDSLRGDCGRLYLPGTRVFTAVDTEDSVVTLDSVPTGTVPSPFFMATSAQQAPVRRLGDSIRVAADDTVIIAPDNGDTVFILLLTASADGMSAGRTVRGFPLAIREMLLPAAARQALAEGWNITVTDDRFTALPLEREDGETGAVFWVLVDTIPADGTVQKLYFFLKEKVAAAPLISVPVFDTANGFSAVWHLDGGCTDATADGYDGEKTGNVEDVNGTLGGAQRFHGDDQITVPGLPGTPATVTLSAWAKLDSTVARGAEVVSIGDAVLVRMDDTWRNKGCHGAYYSNPDAPDTVTHEYIGSGSYLANTGWHYFTYVIDGTAMRQRFYIDGELIGEKTMPAVVRYDKVGTDVAIGNHGNHKTEWNFIGTIDEVRVEHCVRSDTWVRLCYLNQRPEGGLVSAH